jgi:hypothetical protein
MSRTGEPSDDWGHLVQRFDRPEALALVLIGSHARGDAGPLSLEFAR